MKSNLGHWRTSNYGLPCMFLADYTAIGGYTTEHSSEFSSEQSTTVGAARPCAGTCAGLSVCWLVPTCVRSVRRLVVLAVCDTCADLRVAYTRGTARRARVGCVLPARPTGLLVLESHPLTRPHRRGE